jgi:hypothetical protein
MIARRQFGYDAAVGFVHCYLRVKRMRKQTALGIVER